MKLGTLGRPTWLHLNEYGDSREATSNTLKFQEVLTPGQYRFIKKGTHLRETSKLPMNDYAVGCQAEDLGEDIRIFLEHLFGLFVVRELTVVGNEVRINSPVIVDRHLSGFEREQVNNIIRMFWDAPVEPEDAPPLHTMVLPIDRGVWQRDDAIYVALAERFPNLTYPPGQVVVLKEGDWRYDLYEALPVGQQEAILHLLRIQGVDGVTLNESGLWAHVSATDEFYMLALEDSVQDAYDEFRQRTSLHRGRV